MQGEFDDVLMTSRFLCFVNSLAVEKSAFFSPRRKPRRDGNEEDESEGAGEGSYNLLGNEFFIDKSPARDIVSKKKKQKKRHRDPDVSKDKGVDDRSDVVPANAHRAREELAGTDPNVHLAQFLHRLRLRDRNVIKHADSAEDDAGEKNATRIDRTVRTEEEKRRFFGSQTGEMRERRERFGKE